VFLTQREANLNSIEKLQSATGVRVGGHSVGHTIYTLGRVFAYLLRLREPKFITGFSGPELDQAVQRGEVDARVNRVATILQRNPEWVEKKMVDFQAILQIPKGAKHPRFSHELRGEWQPVCFHRRRQQCFQFCFTLRNGNQLTISR